MRSACRASGSWRSPKRYYPAGPLAPQVLGFVGVDATGLAGLEFEYEHVLAGTPGTAHGGAGRRRPADRERHARSWSRPSPGRTLVTTLDREVQYLAQEALRRAVKENHAKGGTIVVMDARTGDVYSMASYPWFDPNDFEDANRDAIRNRAVTDMFEPGSVNKVVTAAAALESGAVGCARCSRCPGGCTSGGYTVNDSHPHPVEPMTLGDIVAHSSNIGSAMVAERVAARSSRRCSRASATGRRPASGSPARRAASSPSSSTGPTSPAPPSPTARASR